MKSWPEGQFELIKGAKHELVMEIPPIRERVLGEICDFFTATA